MASAPLRQEQANARRRGGPRRRPDVAREDLRDVRLVLKTESGARLLRLDEIECLEADGNVVIVHTADGQQHRIRYTLTRLFDELRDRGFLRVRRGAIVRARAIVAVEKGRFRKAFAILRSGLRLEIGRAEFHNLRALWTPGLLDLDALTTGLYLVSDEG